MSTFSFQKSLFSMYINSRGVDKYESESGEIKLVVTHAVDGDTGTFRTFGNEEEYEAWIDSVVDESDFYYNKARALNSVLNELEGQAE